MSDNSMPIRAAPFAHQQEAFEFALALFGENENNEEKGVVEMSKEEAESKGVALLME